MPISHLCAAVIFLTFSFYLSISAPPDYASTAPAHPQCLRDWHARGTGHRGVPLPRVPHAAVEEGSTA